jgi:hypothetical protein
VGDQQPRRECRLGEIAEAAGITGSGLGDVSVELGYGLLCAAELARQLDRYFYGTDIHFTQTDRFGVDVPSRV